MTHSGSARAAARSLTFSSSSSPGTPAARRMVPPGRLLAAVALVALIGAGCSNAPAETGSGNVDNPAATGSTSTEPDPAASQELQQNLPGYAKCMRENGVEDFPDPGPEGIVEYYGDSDRPEFKSAGEKCDDLLPADRGRNPGNGG